MFYFKVVFFVLLGVLWMILITSMSIGGGIIHTTWHEEVHYEDMERFGYTNITTEINGVGGLTKGTPPFGLTEDERLLKKMLDSMAENRGYHDAAMIANQWFMVLALGIVVLMGVVLNWVLRWEE